jgi:glycerol-3-phosphate dehydrogenase
MIGGKWTTYRKMGEDLVDATEKKNGWTRTSTKTKHLKIHGYKENVDHNNPLYFYGSDEAAILELASKNSNKNYISEKLQVIEAQVLWAVENEMCRTVEDFLARRTRCQLLDARESIKMAPHVAEIMANQLGKDDVWKKQQVDEYVNVTMNYILN